jgi:multiple sugar transport system ATP-binding protein
MSGIRLENVTKVFDGDVRAVDGVDLEIADREFVVLVGPSGCGKTTLLRMIAGLEMATEGSVWIGEQDVTKLEPQFRDIAMVFQNYALYPHMSARQNLGFGLRLRRVPKPEIAQRVDSVAKMLGLDELLDRKPSALSGGQRQRVAIGRAMVREPAVYLMDEPLSNLDAKLRVGMRGELARLHARLGVTTVYVTHDQAEAMTLGDRVAVLRAGVLQQCDAPENLFAAPTNLFVASFIGSPAMNLVEAEIGVGGVVFAKQELPLPARLRDRIPQGRAILGIRPGDLHLAGPGADPGQPRMTVSPTVVERLGDQCHVLFTIDAPSFTTDSSHQALDPDVQETQILADEERAVFTAVLDGRAQVAVGQPIEIAIDFERLYLFDVPSGGLLSGAADQVVAAPAQLSARQPAS